MALLVVLLLIATLAAVVSTAQSWGLDTLRRTSSINIQQYDKLALLSVETLFINRYSKLLTANVSTPDLKWMKDMFPISIDEERFHFKVRDLQTCFNINALFADKNKDEKTYSQVRRIFKELLVLTGSDVSTAEKIITDLSANIINSQYLFSDNRQFYFIFNIPQHQIKLLEPNLCTLPVTKLKININGLIKENEILFSALIGSGSLLPSVNDFLAKRPLTGWDSTETINWPGVSDSMDKNHLSIMPFLSISSDYYELNISIDKKSSLKLKTWMSVGPEGIYVFSREYKPTLQ